MLLKFKWKVGLENALAQSRYLYHFSLGMSGGLKKPRHDKDSISACSGISHSWFLVKLFWNVLIGFISGHRASVPTCSNSVSFNNSE